MQLPAGSGLPFGTASLPKSIIPRWTGRRLRDLQYLITDGKSFFHDEKRHLESKLEQSVGPRLGIPLYEFGSGRALCHCQRDHHRPAPGLRSSAHQANRRRIVRLQARLYALCAPHLEVGGWGNNGYVARVAGRTVLIAERKGTWLAMAATVPFSRVSCGYVGSSDGWTDLAGNFQMDWEFDQAPDGNIALTGELDLTGTREFTLGLAFGNSQHHAVSTLFCSR